MSVITTDIRNIKKYLLAVLFNAPPTIDSYYRAKVNHDMANYHGNTDVKDNKAIRHTEKSIFDNIAVGVRNISYERYNYSYTQTEPMGKCTYQENVLNASLSLYTTNTKNADFATFLKKI